MVILYIIVGILGGILGGMGMGGGTVLIPLLTIIFGVNQHTAQIINLISFIPMSIIAIIIHIKNKLINFNGIFIIILFGVLGCFLGTLIAKNISGDMLKRLFGLFLTIISIIEFKKCFMKKE